MKKLISILILLFITVPLCLASQVVIPTTYQTGGNVTAPNLNGNFTAITQVVDGGLDNTNANTTSGYRFFQTVSVLPPAGTQGAVYFLTTDNSLNFDTGSSYIKTVTSSSTAVALPSGAAFYMFSGSCPTGTTDVSATYTNKFIKVNATALTSSGVILTGTTDSHILSITEIPAHTHTVDRNTAGSAFGSVTIASSNNGSIGDTTTTSSAGGGAGHTHTLSTATTLEPSSVTAKLCQVN